MLKRNLLKSAALAAAVICMFLFTACSGDPIKGNTEQTSSQTDVEIGTDQTPSDSSATETQPEPGTEPSETTSEASGSEIVKINGGADETGIYSIVVRLTDRAADKGVIDMVYHGAKGTPQENSVVSTFRIEYCKESDGTYEIHTFFDGEVYQNLHHRDEMKVTNTFGATLRAGDVIISYTPDGGETQEVFKADAEYFFVPTK